MATAPRGHDHPDQLPDADGSRRFSFEPKMDGFLTELPRRFRGEVLGFRASAVEVGEGLLEG
jgi:hypothetical protein